MKQVNRSTTLFDRSEQKAIVLDHEKMMRFLNSMIERYPFLAISYIGESIMGRSLPIITLGEGKKAVLYIGTHHGMEWVTSLVLLRFLREYCELYENKSRLFDLNIRYLFTSRTIYLVPMLNPDGVDYQIHGITQDHILYDRLLAMNGGSSDFSHWQANARGVDLNHNYNSGFAAYKKLEAEHGILGGAPTRYSGEAPESEPEVAHLCNFIRYHDSIKQVLTFHTQGEEIYCGNSQTASAHTQAIGRKLAEWSGYRMAKAEGMAAYGGLSDWCAEELNLPAFTIECGKGKNPLPGIDFFNIYLRMRRLLFLTPTLV